MKTSHRGLVAIEAREGIRLKAYRDLKGLPTIGVGHLIVPGDGFSMSSRITQEQCDALFAEDVQRYETAVNALNVPLSQHQFDALTSFCLNIGTDGFKGSTVAKRLKAKDYNGAAKSMMAWVKPPEITGRRKSEQKQFLTPGPKDSAAAPAEVPAEPVKVTPPEASQTAADEPPPTDPIVPSDQTQPAVTNTTVEKVVTEKTDEGAVVTKTTAETITTPVEVQKESPSWMVKIAAPFTALAGLGINAGSFIQTKIEEMTIQQIGYMVAALGLVVLAIYWWQKSAKAAQVRTLALVEKAADPNATTVVLTK